MGIEKIIQLDKYVLSFINSFAHKSYIFDRAVSIIGDDMAIKGAFLTSLLWLAWFDKRLQQKATREIVIATIYSTFISLLSIKILRHFLPFRHRPIQDNLFGFVPPYGVSTDTLWNWSSFPSDTAGFVMALAVGPVFIWGRKGWLAVAFCVAFICLPRLYLGYHYPSDIVAGVLIGGLMTAVMCQEKIRAPLSRRALSLSESHPGGFYWLFFALTYEIASVFEDVRHALTAIQGFMNHV
jgi:undecaprenyl-diphosphatase